MGIHDQGNDASKLKNTVIWINEHGNITQRYQKIHLFDVEIKDGPVLKESKSVEKGMEIVPPFETSLGKIGSMICFDVGLLPHILSEYSTNQTSLLTTSNTCLQFLLTNLQLRFPEISLRLRRQGAEILTYPSAFTVPTGKAHWEILLRARAIETQSYVIAAAQVGKHNEKRVSYGHSLIIDPWGTVLADLGGKADEPEIATAEIDHDLLRKVRMEVPLLRRTDIYPEL